MRKTDKKIDKPWLFKPGQSGNPNGRPKGQKNYLTLIEEALEEEAKKAGVTYWQRLAQWCFTNPVMAAAILKKFIPDMQYIEQKEKLPRIIIFKDAELDNEVLKEKE